MSKVGETVDRPDSADSKYPERVRVNMGSGKIPGKT